MLNEGTAKEKLATPENHRGLSPAHGNTVAAWTLVLTVIFGSLITAIGFCIPQMILLGIGIAVTIVGFVAGFILKRMGYGMVGPEEFIAEEY